MSLFIDGKDSTAGTIIYDMFIKEDLMVSYNSKI